MECPVYRPSNGLHGLIDVDADAATCEWLLSKFPEISLFHLVIRFHTQEEDTSTQHLNLLQVDTQIINVFYADLNAKLNAIQMQQMGGVYVCDMCGISICIWACSVNTQNVWKIGLYLKKKNP